MAKKIKKKEKGVKKTPKGETQMKAENKIVRNILVGIFLFAICVFLIILFLESSGKFTYQGVKFEIKKFCDSGPPCLTTYRTTLPVKFNGTSAIISKPSEKNNDYNFYLRNDPRKLDVKFEGNLTIKKIMVLNSKEGFVCEGKGSIAGANLIQLYGVLGTQVMKDENATCDSLGRYMFVNIQSGNETSVERIGPACYNINIKDCEILEGTEKFMIETFVKVNKILNNQTIAKG